MALFVMLAVAPWPFFCLALAPAGPALLLLCLAISALGSAGIGHQLRRLSATARELSELALADGADASRFAQVDQIDAIAAAADHLAERVQSVQHRWRWRHGVTNLPVREALVAEIAVDLARADRPALLGAIRFADHRRLAAFDPELAETALQGFAERLVATLGKDRPMAHVDRDCFAIWFRGCGPEAASVELSAIAYALGAEIVAGDTRLVPDVELGIARYPENGAEPGALIAHALVSLARPGTERAASAAPGKSAALAKERFSLEQDLRRAIERGQLAMVFQPVVELSRGLVGAEALLRWHHPEAGPISPTRFIPMLEDADLIDEIGRWTLNAACREARRWQQRGLGTLKVAVNLSAAQLRDPGLEAMIVRTLERHKLPAAALELELTETAATEDAARTFALFTALRARGLSLAIDDFGSGYSSLSYLKNLPFDKLKVDREFVVEIDQRRDSQAICRALVELARGLGLSLLAEGVEQWAEVETLRMLGCTTFQGFLFSEPLDADQFIELARAPKWRRPVPVGGIDQDKGRITA